MTERCTNRSCPSSTAPLADLHQWMVGVLRLCCSVAVGFNEKGAISVGARNPRLVCVREY